MSGLDPASELAAIMGARQPGGLRPDGVGLNIDIGAVARVNESETGEAERRANHAELCQVTADFLRNPKEAAPGESVVGDWRYRMGYIAGLQRRDERIAEARRKMGQRG